jgi:hypothetical protein
VPGVTITGASPAGAAPASGPPGAGLAPVPAPDLTGRPVPVAAVEQALIATAVGHVGGGDQPHRPPQHPRRPARRPLRRHHRIPRRLETVPVLLWHHPPRPAAPRPAAPWPALPPCQPHLARPASRSADSHRPHYAPLSVTAAGLGLPRTVLQTSVLRSEWCATDRPCTPYSREPWSRRTGTAGLGGSCYADRPGQLLASGLRFGMSARGTRPLYPPGKRHADRRADYGMHARSAVQVKPGQAASGPSVETVRFRALQIPESHVGRGHKGGRDCGRAGGEPGYCRSRGTRTLLPNLAHQLRTALNLPLPRADPCAHTYLPSLVRWA